MDEKKLFDLLIQISSDHGEIRDAVNKIAVSQASMQATLEEHMKQDEKMAHELYRVRDCMIKNTQELSEYNTQLAIHIQATEDNRQRIAILEKHREDMMLHKNTVEVSYAVLAKVCAAVIGCCSIIGLILKIIWHVA